MLAGYELFLLVGGSSNGRNEGNGDMQMMMMKSRYDQMWDMFGSCNHKVLRYTLQCQTRSLEKNNNNSKIRRRIKLPH